jgi:hypothetical protein
MAFVGREAELNYLNQYYAGTASRVLVVYGQKGVGKTSLLKTFGADKTCVYYHARSCSDREQRFQWARELSKAGDDLGEFPEYEEIFSRVLSVSAGEKLVFVLDEFQHMVKGNAEFFAKLNQFVHNSSIPLLVILCSSAAGWVENSMVGKIGAEAASISGFLKLRELSVQKMRELYPDFDEDDSIQLYAALGGVPGLWNRMDSELSLAQNLTRNMLDKYSSLYGEMAGCLTAELREPAIYNTILSTMASGGMKLNDIYHHTGFSRAKISVYLKNLMEIDLVEKVDAGIYRITRPCVRFYFSFIYPHLSLFEELTPEQFYMEIVEDAFPGFVREAYRKG